MSEKVLVVPRPKLFSGKTFHGFSTLNPEEILEAIRAHSFYMEREIAEKDPSHKQIIPYAIITHAGRVFAVTRLSTQTEKRLHNKVSIGIGGHINPPDGDPVAKPWENGLKRELSEEVVVDETWTPQLAGMINDDATPVGSVHFGLVYRIELAHGRVRVNETDMMAGEFLAPEKTAPLYPSMETWSQFTFANFWPDHIRPLEPTP